MAAAARRVLVVTGSNKGIGLSTVKALCKEVAKDDVVYLTARSVERGTTAVEELKKENLSPKFHQLDVEDTSSIAAFADYLKKEHGGLDVLVNNAGMAYKPTAKDPFSQQAEHTVRVNYFGLQAVCHALFPLLRSHARVVNMSSVFGHLSFVENEELKKILGSEELTEPQLDQLMRDFIKAATTNTHKELGWPSLAYAASKIGVSALTRVQHRALTADTTRENLIINHCHPGYVKTDMTGHQGMASPDEGAATPVYLALLPRNLPSSAPRGEYVWDDKTVMDWCTDPRPLQLFNETMAAIRKAQQKKKGKETVTNTWHDIFTQQREYLVQILSISVPILEYTVHSCGFII